MNNTEFKKKTQDIISNYGFTYCKKNYYCDYDKIIALINLQKSNYEDSYYINFGFCIKDIHNDLIYPKINECDITGRFVYEANGGKEYKYPLDIMSSEELKINLEKNISTIIIPVFNAGISKFFEMFPEAICVANLSLKKYLGIS